MVNFHYTASFLAKNLKNADKMHHSMKNYMQNSN